MKFHISNGYIVLAAAILLLALIVAIIFAAIGEWRAGLAFFTTLLSVCAVLTALSGDWDLYE